VIIRTPVVRVVSVPVMLFMGVTLLAPFESRAAEVQAAVGGSRILASAERAVAVVTATILRPRPLDVHGYVAQARVEQSLKGRFEIGERVSVAWEELARMRPVRFVDGDRVLLCLEPLPNLTLWNRRFQGGNDKVLIIANQGEAFLRRPNETTLHLLAHYLALGSEGREDPAAQLYLALMVAEASPAVATEALQILDEAPNSAEVIDTLAEAAADESRSLQLRRLVIAWFARAQAQAARTTLAEIAAGDSPVRVPAIYALGVLDGGLSDERIAVLLADQDADARAVGVRFAKTDMWRSRVAIMAASDGSGKVRLSAARSLIETYGIDALDQVAVLLADDDDAELRNGVARSLGELGEVSVSSLAEIAETGSFVSAQSAVLALTYAGSAGGKALATMATSHADSRIRALARLALGQAPSKHKH